MQTISARAGERNQSWVNLFSFSCPSQLSFVFILIQPHLQIIILSNLLKCAEHVNHNHFLYSLMVKEQHHPQSPNNRGQLRLQLSTWSPSTWTALTCRMCCCCSHHLRIFFFPHLVLIRRLDRTPSVEKNQIPQWLVKKKVCVRSRGKWLEEGWSYCLFYIHCCFVTCFFILLVLILATMKQVAERLSKKLGEEPSVANSRSEANRWKREVLISVYSQESAQTWRQLEKD